ncbi:unnamed protein product [Allacma fusca]|uniref:Uncharacterized protein n=1 Tax=Allacma fusca TaxID=39272 RepID=A0A8J2JMY0_9HEXA|nr:unnamed protein product [Allacma fusca]
MSHCGSNANGWGQPSQNCFMQQPQFMNIPGMAPYAHQKCNKTCSSPCCSPYQFGSGSPQQFRPMMMAAPSRNPMMPMGNGHPNVNGIRLRCPSCCRPIGSCTCGCCKCGNCASKTYY